MEYRGLGGTDEGMSLLEIIGGYRFAGPGRVLGHEVSSSRFHDLQVFGWLYLWQLLGLCQSLEILGGGKLILTSSVLYLLPVPVFLVSAGIPFLARNNNYHGMSLGIVGLTPGASSYHHLYHSYIFYRKLITLALRLLRFPG